MTAAQAQAHGTPSDAQRGISLIVVMMLLVIISILGIGSTQISMMGERGARNDRDMQMALQAAEAALTDAAYEIDGPPGAAGRPASFADGDVTRFEAGCGTGRASKGLCAQALAGKPVWQQVDVTDTARTVAFGEFTGRTFATANGAAKGVMPAQAPRYIVEALGDAEVFSNLTQSAETVYRITAMGFGPRRDIQVVLQMLYRKKKT